MSSSNVSRPFRILKQNLPVLDDGDSNMKPEVFGQGTRNPWQCTMGLAIKRAAKQNISR